jgi:hypothetical protein
MGSVGPPPPAFLFLTAREAHDVGRAPERSTDGLASKRAARYGAWMEAFRRRGLTHGHTVEWVARCYRIGGVRIVAVEADADDLKLA